MSTVVAFRDPGWFGNINTDTALYKQTCAAYDVDFIMVEFGDTLPEVDGEIIILDENGDIDLKEFEHPENAVYVFGRANQDLKLLFPSLKSVRINTPHKSALFGCVACGIVLEDRNNK